MGRRLRIVVADDERDTREYFQFFLTHLGHDVRGAADGLQLIDVCHEFAPDLIVTDYAMPGRDGLAAVTEVNRERSAPAILISGRVDAALPAHSVGSPVVKVLAKPVKEAELRVAVESLAARVACPV